MHNMAATNHLRAPCWRRNGLESRTQGDSYMELASCHAINPEYW